jgi:hypothetical protein
MEDFDWVTNRFNCSLARMFKQLELGCRKDVDTLKDFDRPDPSLGGRPPKELFVEGNGAEFSVTRRDFASTQLRSMTFRLDTGAITVSGDFPGAPRFSAGITLTDEGKCLLAVDGNELRLWQVRRKALQDLLFGA